MSERTRRVAILGAGGLVGGVLREGLADAYEVHSFDRRRGAGTGVRRLDARRPRALARALAGCDAVVDLVSDARPDAPWRAVYRTNLRVVPTVLEAARRAGVSRVVYASSNHAFAGYERLEPWASVVSGHLDALSPADVPHLSADSPPRARSAYGASKVFGEAACDWYAAQFAMSVTSLRIGTVLQPDRPRNVRHLATWLSHRDLVGLVDAALRCPADDLPRAVWGVSANTWRLWDTDPTYGGYVRQDDAESFRREVSTRS